MISLVCAKPVPDKTQSSTAKTRQRVSGNLCMIPPAQSYISEIERDSHLHLPLAVQRGLRAAGFRKNSVRSERGQTRPGRGVGARATGRSGRAQIEFVLIHAENVRAVEEVEGFGDEVEPEPLFEAELFRQAQINVFQRALVVSIGRWEIASNVRPWSFCFSSL
jgi:hypothetical protein